MLSLPRPWRHCPRLIRSPSSPNNLQTKREQKISTEQSPFMRDEPPTMRVWQRARKGKERAFFGLRRKKAGVGGELQVRVEEKGQRAQVHGRCGFCARPLRAGRSAFWVGSCSPPLGKGEGGWIVGVLGRGVFQRVSCEWRGKWADSDHSWRRLVIWS